MCMLDHMTARDDPLGCNEESTPHAENASGRIENGNRHNPRFHTTNEITQILLRRECKWREKAEKKQRGETSLHHEGTLR